MKYHEQHFGLPTNTGLHASNASEIDSETAGDTSECG
jgi:hypothetical protein